MTIDVSAELAIELDRAVATGAALLDKRGPADWRDRVNLVGLDTSSTIRCVVGQVFTPDYGAWNAWSRGLTQLGVPDVDGARDEGLVPLGFEAPDELFGRPYSALTAAWRRYLDGDATQVQDQDQAEGESP